MVVSAGLMFTCIMDKILFMMRKCIVVEHCFDSNLSEKVDGMRVCLSLCFDCDLWAREMICMFSKIAASARIEPYDFVSLLESISCMFWDRFLATNQWKTCFAGLRQCWKVHCYYVLHWISSATALATVRNSGMFGSLCSSSTWIVHSAPLCIGFCEGQMWTLSLILECG